LKGQPSSANSAPLRTKMVGPHLHSDLVRLYFLASLINYSAALPGRRHTTSILKQSYLRMSLALTREGWRPRSELVFRELVDWVVPGHFLLPFAYFITWLRGTL